MIEGLGGSVGGRFDESISGNWYTHTVSCRHGLVKHCRARFVFGWVTVLVCKFPVNAFKNPSVEAVSQGPWRFS